MKQKPSVFTTHIRIRPSRLKWIKEHLGSCKTAAGRLDEIIGLFAKSCEQDINNHGMVGELDDVRIYKPGEPLLTIAPSHEALPDEQKARTDTNI